MIKRNFLIFMALYLKVFMTRFKNYAFKKILSAADNKRNFNHNLKN